GGDDSPSPTPVSPSGTPDGVIPGFADPSRWAGRTLRVGAWGGEVQDALRLALWRPFASATGCEILEVVTDYERLQLSTESGDPYVDVLVVDEIWAATDAASELLTPIEPGSIDLVPVSSNAAPAYAYGMVSAYRWDNPASEPPRTWTAWWNQERFPGERSLWKGPLGTFEFALLADGVAPADLYPLDIPRAIERLAAISGAIGDRWWENGREPVTWLSQDRIQFSSAWHYRVVAGQRDARPIDFVWDQGLLLADQWVIPNGAVGSDIAADFLRYASTPEAQASLARLVPLGPIVGGAFDYLEPTLAAQLPTAPGSIDLLVPLNVAWWAENFEEANQRFVSDLLGESNV
ncbi:MAG: extracellular solute-binding protein, partial [Chloroflexota bacterium]|nr:extracellular solute-binding protein [Chloroflexota bacterium]